MLRLAVCVICRVWFHILEYTITRKHKKICGFTGLRPMRLCVSVNISRACSRIFPATPHPRLPGGRLKSRKYKKSAVGGKKVRLTPVQKKITLFYIGRCQTDGLTQSAFFLPPKADFFYGHRPLFEPCRLLSSCKAWRWGWRRRQGGKLVFRLASPTVPKKAKPTTAAMAFCVYINLLHKSVIMY